MAWQYSNPLNNALLANTNVHSDIGLRSSSLYQPYYSNFDPLVSRYQARTNYFNDRTPGSLHLFDDIDELELEVETDTIMSSRFRPNVYNHTAYVPSYYNKDSFSLYDEGNGEDLMNSKNIKTSKSDPIPQQPPINFQKLKVQNQQQQHISQFNNDNNNNNINSNYFQHAFKPIPFLANPSNMLNNNNQNYNNFNFHNSQQQRFIQYQQRMNQNQNLSELESLKIKQYQDRNTNNDNLNFKINNNKNNNNIINYKYQPFFQDYHLKHKQYSETSIPSTNADPLNSNNPTPPITNRKQKNQGIKNFNLLNNNQNNKKLQNILKLVDDPQDPGSYLNTMRDTRVREQRVAKEKYTASDYRSYQKNFGFGKDFLPFENETKREKLEKARKREEYSKMIKERNTNLLDNTNFNIANNSNQSGKFNPNSYSNYSNEQIMSKKNNLINTYNKDLENTKKIIKQNKF